MKREYILALDQGTTSSRAMLFDFALAPVGAAGRDFPQHFPRNGWVEHDPEDLAGTTFTAIEEVLRQTGVEPAEVRAVGIANQRETVLVWRRATGRPIYPAIVWQCRRTADFCREVAASAFAGAIRERTGLIADPYFSASKLRWILDNVPDARRRAEAGELCFGTVDSYLAWHLSGGREHVTDYTNASRTMLFNIHTLDWDDELLAYFGIPRAMLPRVVPSSGVLATCRHPALDNRPIPLAGIAGDQQAALHGQFCDRPGELKITYGTGAFLLLNTGSEAIPSRHNLVTTLGAGSRAGAPEFLLEGSVFMAGAIMQWLRDGLGVIADAREAGAIAASVPDTGGVYLVPAFTGLGAPYWDAEARAALLGMTRATTRREIIRAAEEAIAYQCADLVEAMRRDLEGPIAGIRVDGGAARDDFLLQFQADLLGCSVERPACLESTGLGAARLALAGIGCGAGSASDVGGMEFCPRMEAARREALIGGWRRAVAKVIMTPQK